MWTPPISNLGLKWATHIHATTRMRCTREFVDFTKLCSNLVMRVEAPSSTCTLVRRNWSILGTSLVLRWHPGVKEGIIIQMQMMRSRPTKLASKSGQAYKIKNLDRILMCWLVSQWAYGVVVSHPLRMRKPLGSNPSGSNFSVMFQQPHMPWLVFCSICAGHRDARDIAWRLGSVSDAQEPVWEFFCEVWNIQVVRIELTTFRVWGERHSH